MSPCWCLPGLVALIPRLWPPARADLSHSPETFSASGHQPAGRVGVTTSGCRSRVARIQFDDQVLELQTGGFMNISAHQKHSVSWTTPDKTSQR